MDEADVLFNIGSLNMEQKNYDTAEKYYMQALDMQTRMSTRKKN